ncbi:MAG TPA: MBL fold metallo-hydrolase [Acidimicrobiales bacterium]|nr:MBL fold metallo-hydrolase [Acidimicrobiales bacterium]
MRIGRYRIDPVVDGEGRQPASEVFPGLRPCMERFESLDEGVLFPGIDVRHAPGHTPGSAVVVLSEGNRRVVVLGDVAHSPVQLLEREWNTPYDVDPVLARSTREDVLRDLDGDLAALVAGMHFPGLRFGRVLDVEGRRRWVV